MHWPRCPYHASESQFLPSFFPPVPWHWHTWLARVENSTLSEDLRSLSLNPRLEIHIFSVFQLKEMDVSLYAAKDTWCSHSTLNQLLVLVNLLLAFSKVSMTSRKIHIIPQSLWLLLHPITQTYKMLLLPVCSHPLTLYPRLQVITVYTISQLQNATNISIISTVSEMVLILSLLVTNPLPKYHFRVFFLQPSLQVTFLRKHTLRWISIYRRVWIIFFWWKGFFHK